MAFHHISSIVRQIKTDAHTYWGQLYDKLVAQHPELTPEELQKRLIPDVTYSFIIRRGTPEEGVCVMPCRLLKSHGSNTMFHVSLMFETAIQDVYEVVRDVRVIAMVNKDPEDKSMNFLAAADAKKIDEILRENQKD